MLKVNGVNEWQMDWDLNGFEFCSDQLFIAIIDVFAEVVVLTTFNDAMEALLRKTRTKYKKSFN